MERSKFQKVLIAVWLPIYRSINNAISFLILLIQKYAKIAMNQIKNNG